MIELEKVVKTFPGGKVAVRDLSFTVDNGEFCVLIGPSGCGKSTTLRMINRLTNITSGRISIGGEEITAFRPEILRRRIGYSIQTVGLFPHMTVAQNISTVPGLLRWEKGRIDRRINDLLDLLNLDPGTYCGKYPRQLSGGEAQRVGVARALAADPEILLMDEPFGAIDPINRQTLQTEFARIQKDLKKTIVFVTHDIDEAIRLASRIVILRDGMLVQNDTPENIMTRPADRFVSEFIGTDRALKRLSRLKVTAYLKEASSIKISTPLSDTPPFAGKIPCLWVVDAGGRVIGWLGGDESTAAGETVSERMNRMDLASGGITPDSTLKEALSRMIQQGNRSAPVVDDGGALLGEIRLSDILEA
jgi:osmoprotectant transport system ATP-binding protein